MPRAFGPKDPPDRSVSKLPPLSAPSATATTPAAVMAPRIRWMSRFDSMRLAASQASEAVWTRRSHETKALPHSAGVGALQLVTSVNPAKA